MPSQLPPARAIRLPQVCDMTGLSRATVWRFARDDPQFPKPFRLSEAATVWDEPEILSWVQTKRATRGHP